MIRLLLSAIVTLLVLDVYGQKVQVENPKALIMGQWQEAIEGKTIWKFDSTKLFRTSLGDTQAGIEELSQDQGDEYYISNDPNYPTVPLVLGNDKRYYLHIKLDSFSDYLSFEIDGIDEQSITLLRLATGKWLTLNRVE